jgi:hypothetical protein
LYSSDAEGKRGDYNGIIHLLFTDFKKAYDSVMKEVLYNILTEFGVPMKLFKLIKMSLNETESKVDIANICLTIFLTKLV